jgi:hypothetical protein
MVPFTTLLSFMTLEYSSLTSGCISPLETRASWLLPVSGTVAHAYAESPTTKINSIFFIGSLINLRIKIQKEYQGSVRKLILVFSLKLFLHAKIKSSFKPHSGSQKLPWENDKPLYFLVGNAFQTSFCSFLETEN